MSLFKSVIVVYNKYGGGKNMSVRFSRVKAITKNRAALFLVGGIPSSRENLERWTAFKSFTEGVKENEPITAYIESFIYGEGDVYDATPEEIAYFYIRIEKRPDFIESRTRKTGESEFSFWLTK